MCGLGTGQHMYLDAYPGKNLDATIAISIGSASSTGRRWSIRVTQIDCGTLYTAPQGCLQYHTGIMVWAYFLPHRSLNKPSLQFLAILRNFFLNFVFKPWWKWWWNDVFQVLQVPYRPGTMRTPTTYTPTVRTTLSVFAGRKATVLIHTWQTLLQIVLVWMVPTLRGEGELSAD